MGTDGSVGAAGVSVGTVGVLVGVAVGVLVGVLVGVGVLVMPANGAASLTLPPELINPTTNRIAIKRQPVKIDLVILLPPAAQRIQSSERQHYSSTIIVKS